MENVEAIQNLLVTAIWLLPLVTAVTEIIKRALPGLDTRYIPVVSSIVGVVAGLFILELSLIGGVTGLILGLGATGLWEFGKTTLAGK